MIKAEKPLLILNASRGGVDGSEGCFYYRIGLKTVPKEIEERYGLSSLYCYQS